MREILIGLMMIAMLFFNAPTGEVASPVEVKINQVNFNQGELLSLEVTGTKVQPKGTFLGTPLNFQYHQEKWVALFGISYWTEPGNYTLTITLPDGTQTQQSIKIAKGEFKESRLTVTEDQSRIVNPAPEDTAIIQRRERDAKRLEQAYSQSEPKPLWTETFVRPAEGRVTTGFGDTRYVNGRLSSRHNGLDIANPVGTPIISVNNGIVRLAEDLLVTGFTIVIDHGAGLYSSYSHLSELSVKEGDRVTRGQVIGKMGSTGFSTGPHLHWVMRVGNAALDPDLFMGTDIFRDIKVPIYQ